MIGQMVPALIETNFSDVMQEMFFGRLLIIGAVFVGLLLLVLVAAVLLRRPRR